MACHSLSGIYLEISKSMTAQLIGTVYFKSYGKSSHAFFDGPINNFVGPFG